MSAPPNPDGEFARWLAAHPAATLLEIAACVARLDPGTRARAAAIVIPAGGPPGRR